MTSVLRSILPNSSVKSQDYDDYSVEYSFAIQYSGPPVSHDIPQVVPVDVRRIPTASVAARDAMFNNLSIPVIQPILKRSEKILSKEQKSEKLGKFGNSRIYSRKTKNNSHSEGKLEIVVGGGGVSEALSCTSSSTLGFSDGHNDSNKLSISSDLENLHDDCEVNLPCDNRSNSLRKPELCSEISSSEVEEFCIDDIFSPSQSNRTAVVTLRNLPSNHATLDESDNDEPEIFLEKKIVSDFKKGLCYHCNKRKRFSDKEVCIVCGSKYCSKCVIRTMGCMLEGRKCISCIGYPIDESKRGSLGKCSGMLKRLLSNDAIKQIMTSEISCSVNQLPPHLICVNDKQLSIEELVMLQSCPNPPKKLRPGKYWYDRVSGFWGKKGEKPSQIISADLAVGYQIRKDASNGNTNVLINNREITKVELWMLQAAGIHSEGNPHFWVTADGSYQLEGMNYVNGKLWKNRRVKIVCAALSLPFPSDMSNHGSEGVGKEMDKSNQKNLERRLMNKFLLVGCDGSGTSTIFKQAKILYDVPFSEDERQNIKYVIQRNLYSYIAILLEGHEQFAEEYVTEMRRLVDEPGTSGNILEVDEKNVYSFSPRLKAFSSWLLQVMMSGNLEAIFPAATREYSLLVEELWQDKAFQATYKRRNELPKLPRVANYFLDRAAEISRADYEPSEMDILYAEGITSSNGVASIEFSFPKSSQDGYMEPLDQNDPSTSYQLIRVHASSLGENCKWLEMFEDVDLVIFCVSLTEYDEYHEDINGIRTNKMLATKKFFETIVNHPTLSKKDFLLVLTKFDLLEEKIQQVPLTQCEWFQDFTPVINIHSGNVTSNKPPLAQKAFHYMAVKFKRLFDSLTDRKLFVSPVTGLEPDSVDKALKYGREVLKWDDEKVVFSTNEYSTESGEHGTYE